MAAQRTTSTLPELALRSALHRAGVRYRVNCRPIGSLRVKADIVFGPTRVAVFVDGCFWHSCPVHATQPKANGEWWADKLGRNVARDRTNDALLRDAGWEVLRVWEHENPLEAADRIVQVVRDRRRQASGSRRTR